MEGMSGGPILSRRGVIGMVDCGGRGAIEMGGHSYTEAKAPHTIIEVLKRCLVLQVRCSHRLMHVHTSNRYITLLPCSLLATH